MTTTTETRPPLRPRAHPDLAAQLEAKLAAATKARADLKAELDAADRAWRAVVTETLAAGLSGVAAARVTGVTRRRLYQVASEVDASRG